VTVLWEFFTAAVTETVTATGTSEDFLRGSWGSEEVKMIVWGGEQTQYTGIIIFTNKIRNVLKT